MLELRISPLAEQDLIDIWLYIAQDQPLNADRFVDKLYQTAQRLAEYPGLGVSRENIAAGIYAFPFAAYVLYYRCSDVTLELVRVLSATRDLESLYW